MIVTIEFFALPNPSAHFLRSRDILDLDKEAGLTDQLEPVPDIQVAIVIISCSLERE